MEKIFEKAVRSKLRFAFKGQLSVEDLWDLPVDDLDSIYKTLEAKKEASSAKSLLNKKTKEDETVELQIEIIKRIVEVKLEEADAKVTAKAKADEKKKLLGILAAKKENELLNLSAEEIEKRIAELSE